jgi:hypothetical protein
LGLYKGLGAVLTGIIPKMAIRFTSYEQYKQLLADEDGKVSGPGTFLGKCISILEVARNPPNNCCWHWDVFIPESQWSRDQLWGELSRHLNEKIR